MSTGAFSQTKMVRFLCCGVGDQTYGVRMTWVRGVQRAEHLRRQAPPQGGLVGSHKVLRICLCVV